ncbi:hypothetical protein [Paraburkholderia fynbosensis]|uniref:Uncharacterized protein n=1 Tax=Paraburkholderia fynbosensis TaxID=1200993 RepID=A0A6J5GSZ6_9BURK|nr:hypothetical protein [Paraburkholderia fynbosensis]CAB3804682.1 hypothetical protein LMG27177_05721 [Paraburkholderia fynbosensis]
MQSGTALDFERLKACVRANSDDAAVWRWYSDMMEDRRIECLCVNGNWAVKLDGREIAADRSFDRAARLSYATSRALISIAANG